MTPSTVNDPFDIRLVRRGLPRLSLGRLIPSAHAGTPTPDHMLFALSRAALIAVRLLWVGGGVNPFCQPDGLPKGAAARLL